MSNLLFYGNTWPKNVGRFCYEHNDLYKILKFPSLYVYICNYFVDIDRQCKQILKPLVSSNTFPVTIKLNIHAYTDYSIEYVDGIFLRALISNWNNNSKDVGHDWLQRVTCTLLKLIKPTCPYLDTLYEVCQLKVIFTLN